MPAKMAAIVIDHLLRALPHEGVGLVGVAPHQTWRARVFYPGTNRDQSPLRYTMAPEEVFTALRDMAAMGLQLGAIVHSHPNSAAVPSATDLHEAYYDEVVMLIADLSDPSRQFRGWRVHGHGVALTATEVRVELDVGFH